MSFPASSAINGTLLFLAFSFLMIFLYYLLKKERNKSQNSIEMITLVLERQKEIEWALKNVANNFGQRQTELDRNFHEKLHAVDINIINNLHKQASATQENLSALQQRLMSIDQAQNNIQNLAGQIVQLQAILNDKQTRGAFGQARMEMIISDHLPKEYYSFQATLSNNARPDCLIHMPNKAPKLVIDAKFPLSAWQKRNDATTEEQKRAAESQFRRDMEKHILDIAAKYLIKDETQDMAFLFIPSESIFTTLHEEFPAIIQKAYKANVVIVSPALLMLAINLIQALLKDAKMREQARAIQKEVHKLMENVSRLDERVRKLKSHFQQTDKDLTDIIISTQKVIQQGKKINDLEFKEETTSNDVNTF